MLDSCIKIILTGDSGVGKSSLLYSYIHNKKGVNLGNTIGLDCLSKSIWINNSNHKLLFWDTAGQEKFYSMSKFYYRNSEIVFFVFGIDDKKSFENLDKWINLIKETQVSLPYSVLIGNKKDCKDLRQVTTQQAQEFAKKHGMSYRELTQENILEANNFITLTIEDYIKLDSPRDQLNTPPQEGNIIDMLSFGGGELCC